MVSRHGCSSRTFMTCSTAWSNLARQLMVEPDPVTGELRPVTNRGWPVYMHLCREERENG